MNERPNLRLVQRFRTDLIILTVAPWFGPIITLIRDDQDRMAFLIWPLIYAAIGTYLAQPGRFLKQSHAKSWGKTAYNSKIVSLFFLCLFEIMANCLAPPLQRFAIAICLFVPYLISGVIFLRAAIKIEAASVKIEPDAPLNGGSPT